MKPTPKQLRALAVQTRMWALFEAKLFTPSRKLIASDVVRGANGFVKGGLSGMNSALGVKQSQAWFRVLAPHNARVGTTFGKLTFDQLGVKSLVRIAMKAEGAGAGAGAGAGEAAFVEFEAELAGWIASEGLKNAKVIVGTTKAEMRALITRLELEGLGVEAIGRQIKLAAPGISARRARTIARTETHTAANFANQSAARSTEIELAKTWLAHPSERTRDTHIGASGQQVAMDEPYNVGGFDLMYPGDASLGAPAEEVIECRCGESYDPIQ